MKLHNTIGGVNWTIGGVNRILCLTPYTLYPYTLYPIPNTSFKRIKQNKQ